MNNLDVIDLIDTTKDVTFNRNEGERLFTIMTTRINEYYYLPNFGSDTLQWIRNNTNYSLQQFSNYLNSIISLYDLNLIINNIIIEKGNLIIYTTDLTTNEPIEIKQIQTGVL